jgi:hypothetical protein
METQHGAAGSTIFISYRREDVALEVGCVHDRLAATFGRDAAYKDLESLGLGRDFSQETGTATSERALE